MRILVIEDEVSLAEQIKKTLSDAGYTVDLAHDGEEGHYLGSNESYDAVVLDLGLPKIDGLTVLEKWRSEDKKMPVLILTAGTSGAIRLQVLTQGPMTMLRSLFKRKKYSHD